MHWYGDDASGWGYALMAAGMVVLWALLILGLIALLRSWRQTPESPERILAERFARGEIDEVEYHTRLEVLRAESNPARGRSTLGTASAPGQRGR